MGFFDLKLIIIIALTIICYFIYKELLHINKKVNYSYSRLIKLENYYNGLNGITPLNIENELVNLNNLDIQTDNLSESNNSLEPKFNNSLEPKFNNSLEPKFNNSLEPEFNNSLEPEFNNSQEHNYNSEQYQLEINRQNELNKLNEEYISIQNELRNLPQDTSTEINYVFDQIAMVPLNIPFNFNLLNAKQYDILPKINEVSNESFSNETESVLNSETLTEKSIQSHKSETQLTNKSNETKTSKEIKEETISSETSENKITTPLEEFSNDNNDNVENIQNNSTLKINESKLENILKNLNKYKLPELQDIAIEYKLGLQLNGKNKNKNQLLNDIKNFILNKNI